MAQRLVGGQVYDIPADSDGMVPVEAIREICSIPDDRNLVGQRSDGGNVVLPGRGRVLIERYIGFMDAPEAVRGLTS